MTYTQALGNDLSPMMATLVEDLVWLDFYVLTCDHHLSQLRQFVRKGKPHPLVDVRVKLANSRRENLKLMGFKRVAKDSETLEEYLARTYGNRDADENAAGAAQDGQGATNEATEEQEGE